MPSKTRPDKMDRRHTLGGVSSASRRANGRHTEFWVEVERGYIIGSIHASRIESVRLLRSSAVANHGWSGVQRWES